jgi:hypothetical protein
MARLGVVIVAAVAVTAGGCNQDCEMQNGAVQRPLSSLCAAGSTTDCPASPADLVARCSGATPEQPLVRAEGCGLARYESTSLSGTSYTFDAQSGKLVGVYQWSDVPWGECQAFGYRYGTNLLIGISGGCPEAETTFCTLCGSGSGYPSCP